ncbi:MAG: hypothetical protein NTY12_03745 [Candidatus Falkowbacteria bacterium]|nr:hypothetical protein [Candidatus Falkowbacteria bacterium]
MKTILVDAVFAFIIESQDGFKIFEPMRQMLDEFPNKKIILTNASDEKFEEYGLNNMPYEFFTLKHNPDKIDSEYYKKMLGHFELKADDVVYFEHSPEAVESARSVGIKTFLWDNEKRPLEEPAAFIRQNV